MFSEATNNRRLVNMAGVVTGPVELEQRYVHNVYTSIASHICKQRAIAWPKVRAMLASMPKGSIVADVGMTDYHE